MRALILIFLFLFGLVSSFVFMAAEANAASEESKAINDSLVQDLSCKNLTVASIYKSIKDDAFNESFNFPVQNWTFEDGLPGLANCWALAKNQRMISYLARYNVSSDKPLDKRVVSILDMIRGATVVGKGKEKPLSSYQVFEVEESNFYKAEKASGWNLFKGIIYGNVQNFGGDVVSRKFQYEIEAKQEDSFFSLKNLNMIWRKGKRPGKKNQETLKALITNLDSKKLTLLNLRMGRTSQHIVMAKSYEYYSNGIYEFTVFDSNYPWADAKVYYDVHKNSFTAPKIVRRILSDKTDRDLGVFIVSEEERKPLEAAMLEHYQKLCR